MTRIPLTPDDASDTISPDARGTIAPEVSVAIFFITFFLVIALLQTYQSVRYRSPVTWSITTTAILECFSLVEYAYHTTYPTSTSWLITGTLTHWLAPTVLTFYCIQVFGRAAWEAVLTNRQHLRSLIGFIRWNTVIFGSLSFAAWFILCIGSAVVVAVAPNGEVNQSNLAVVDSGYGVLKAGLIIQLIILLACSLIVWRFKSTAAPWNVEWNEKRKFVWTWRNIVTMALISFGLLGVRQIYHLVRFFLNYSDLPWLALVLDTGPICVIMVMFTIFHPGRCLSIELLGFRVKKDCHKPAGDILPKNDPKLSRPPSSE